MEERYLQFWPEWNMIRMLGRGNFGRVYEIERDVFGHKEKAALKVISIPQSEGDIEELRNDGYDDQSITQRFEGYLQDVVREYALMAEMKGHPNVVYCDDVKFAQRNGGLGWDIFIKMELLEPLPRYLTGTVTEEQVIKIGMDLCSALIYCNQRNIIHRDIKPQNIFVSPGGAYKLGDFGIAKTAERTTSGTKVGTYKYMAPEVYHNRPYGAKADLYSLGLVLYWLLNERRTPFLPLPPEVPKASMEDNARHRRFSGEPLPPPAHGSEALKQIVLKACAFDPEQRFEDASEMRTALRRIVPAQQSAKSQGIPQRATTAPEHNEIADHTVDLYASTLDNGQTTAAARAEGIELHSDQADGGTVVMPPDSEDADAAGTVICENLEETADEVTRLIPEEPTEATQAITPDEESRKPTAASGRPSKRNAKRPKSKRSRMLLIAAGILLAIVAAGMTCFFTIHNWTEATCTEASRCTICGKVRREALGHDWVEATCTAAKHCKRCGAIEGTKLEHQWIEATYTQPKTCSVCGLKSGNVKGWIGYVSFRWSEEKIDLNSPATGYVRGEYSQLDKTVEKCMQMDVICSFGDGAEGYPYGTWYICARTPDRGWIRIGEIEYGEGDTSGTRLVSLEFDTPITFDALMLARSTNGDGYWHSSFWISRVSGVQVYVD